MSKSAASHTPTEDEYPSVAKPDYSDVDACLAECRAILEAETRRLTARDLKRAAQQSATTQTLAPGTTRSTSDNTKNTTKIPSASTQTASAGARPSGYGILSHVPSPTRKFYAILTRMPKEEEDGGELTEEDMVELGEDLKQFIRAASPTHPVLEVWGDHQETMRVCREMLLRSSSSEMTE